MAESIHVVATLEAAEGKAEELEAVLLSMLPLSRKDDGCVSYHLHEDRDHEGRFVFVEEWRDGDALAAHGKAPHMAESGAKLRGLLAGRPTIVRLRRLG